jgi:hypothetical protein
MPLSVLKSPPLSQAAAKRLEAASCSSPSFRNGERNSEGVSALQAALLLLQDPTIDIPAGVTGNYLDQTVTAVRAFQKRYNLVIDGIAGRQTVTRLDALLEQRAQRSLQTLDRVLNDLKRKNNDDAYRAQILREMETTLANMRRGNDLGFAMTAPVIGIIVVLFFLLLMLSLPSTQKALRDLMKQMIEAVNERGEVAKEKIEKLKQDIKKFLDQAREIRTDCMTETLAKNPKKHAECMRRFGAAMKAAFEALIRVMRDLFVTIIDQFGRSRFRIPPALRMATLSKAFVDYVNALNDFLNCLDCPEVPIPVFPDHPDFPL